MKTIWFINGLLASQPSKTTVELNSENDTASTLYYEFETQLPEQIRVLTFNADGLFTEHLLWEKGKDNIVSYKDQGFRELIMRKASW